MCFSILSRKNFLDKFEFCFIKKRKKLIFQRLKKLFGKKIPDKKSSKKFLYVFYLVKKFQIKNLVKKFLYVFLFGKIQVLL